MTRSIAPQNQTRRQLKHTIIHPHQEYKRLALPLRFPPDTLRARDHPAPNKKADS
ncbi:predicted protein [Botrytis cinerea T4]|uniref:Uncharacterized protein n=1 Tax=Botryotinia fuckeliana (strain T4) TaxID=999810 RepID=G2YC53_BOTF4|nr:predicted protein [Botrytis cinerea T4]